MKKQKILHMFLVEKFTDAFVNFVNSNFEMESHTFLVYGRKRYNLACYHEKNVMYRPNIKQYLSQSANREKLMLYDKIIIHGLFDQDVLDVWFLDKKLCDKTYLYMWGGDFYPESLKDESWQQNIKRRYIIRNAKGIINILSNENKIIDRLYHARGKKYSVFYYDSDQSERIIGTPLKKIKNQLPIKIQVGNSAFKTNGHIEILDRLYRYRNENILIYAPLSYGDKMYAKEVVRYGKKLFGDKFIPMMEYMDVDKYLDFMKEMNIAMFNSSRQQALGNIVNHLAFGNIVYLRKKSVTTYFLRKEQGCVVRYLEDMDSHSFEKLYHQTEKARCHNREKMLEMFDERTLIKKWKKIFDEF